MLFFHPARTAYPCVVNNLAQSDSAYLQQHANNPVDWWPWNAESLEAAAAQGQWLLVSIGYSACHWCHVMEREIFEDADCASYMNAHFRNIKVDREERPDIDQAYMDAALALSGQGGWPLNVVCLPDGRPIWASTYLPKERWLAALEQLVGIREEHADLPGPYAQRLVDALEASLLPSSQTLPLPQSLDELPAWDSAWDPDHGGFRGAPKFPLPALWTEVARLPRAGKDGPDHSLMTLRSILRSGSYDALRGGLFRYSTDPVWQVPHFEKMAYDNGLWMRWAAAAYARKSEPFFAEAFKSTAEWLFREMRLPSGLFAASLDADYAGQEGRSYTWTESELESSLDADCAARAIQLFKAQGPAWENQWILHRHPQENDLKVHQAWEDLLVDLRPHALQRSLPFRDDKSVHAWNAYIVVGLAEGALHFPPWKARAVESAKAHWEAFGADHGTIGHVVYPGKTTQGRAFLDDLAATMACCIAMAQLTLDPLWVDRCDALIQQANSGHWDGQAYTFSHRDQAEPAFMNHYDWEDDVLPSAQAGIARTLIYLGHLRQRSDYLQRARHLIVAANLSEREVRQSLSWWSLIPWVQDHVEHLIIKPKAHLMHALPAHFWLWGPGETVKGPFGQLCHMTACTLAFETDTDLHAYFQKD